MTICKFYALECVCVGEGSIGVWLLLGAPNMHKIDGLNFARQWC